MSTESVKINLDPLGELRVFSNGNVFKDLNSSQKANIVRAIQQECSTCWLLCSRAASIGGQGEVRGNDGDSIRHPDCPADGIVVGI